MKAEINIIDAPKQLIVPFLVEMQNNDGHILLVHEIATVNGEYIGTYLNGEHIGKSYGTLTLLNESALGLAGENTAIGDAIGLAVKRLRKQQANSRVLVLLTDGANTAGEVSPIKAAELAADNHLKIYTIGIGADEMTVRSFFGKRKVNPSRDLDEKTLTAIAEKTGGRYFRAKNTKEMEQIYQLLDELEPVEKDKQYFRPKTELYHWPLAIALLLAGVISLSRLNRR